MTDRKRIQPRVDAALWERFRNDVQNRKGQTRGVLGDELENAIREYLREDATPTERRLEKRIARIEEAVGAAPPDGSVAPSNAETHTHAPSRLDVDEKPPANAATDKKVAYLAAQVEAEVGEHFQEVPETTLLQVVKDEYGFRRDTTKRYVERLVEHFDLVDHPEIDPLLVTREKREELRDQRREELRADAEAELQGVTADD